LYKRTQRRDLGHIQRKHSLAMTSQIPKISGNCRQMHYNFKMSSFCNIIHPFLLHTRTCVVIIRSKLLFYSLSIKTFAYHF